MNLSFFTNSLMPKMPKNLKPPLKKNKNQVKFRKSRQFRHFILFLFNEYKQTYKTNLFPFLFPSSRGIPIISNIYIIKG